MLRWVKDNQVLAFTITAFLLSWSIWAASPILGGGEDAQRIISSVGAFGPSAAAVLISLLLGGSDKDCLNGKAFFLSFPLIYALAVLSLNPVFQARFQLQNVALLALPSAIAAAFFALAFSRNPAAGMLKSLVELRVPGKWYALSLLLFPAAVVFGALLDSYLTGTAISLYSGSLALYIYLQVLTFLGYGLFGGSLNEEVGWRGFALPRLLKRFRPLAATLILGAIWTVWHAPLHFTSFYGDGLPGFLARFPANIALTFFFTHLYLKSEGSLFLAVLLHTSVNFSFTMFPITANATYYSNILLLVFIVVAIIHNRRLWFPPRPQQAASEAPHA
jgi:membrane protease YdiL (CAAX protease family)